jgi:xanthosine utilization system XapX-like protein
VSERKKSQTGFVAVTLITLLAIAMVLVVYSAILLGTPTGKEVTVGGVTGTIYYSTTQSGPWTQETLSVNPAGSAWYAALITPGGQYVGPVSISWQLYKKGTASDWSDENPAGSAQSTSIVLTSGSQTIFVEPYGNDSASNFNWGQSGYGNSPGSYRIVATIQSTG